MAKASGSIDLKSLKVAGEGANKYITDIDSNNGITITAANGTASGSDDTKKNYIKLNASGLEVYQQGTLKASFSSDVNLYTSNGNMELNSYGIKISKGRAPFFYIYDFGAYARAHNNNQFDIAFPVSSSTGYADYSFYHYIDSLDSTTFPSGYTISTINPYKFRVTPPPTDTIIVKGTSSRSTYNYGGAIGTPKYISQSSFGVGVDTAALAEVSFVGGYGSRTYGRNSIAFGHEAITGMLDSTVEEYLGNDFDDSLYMPLLGFEQVDDDQDEWGHCCISIGKSTNAKHSYTQAFGEGTITANEHQMVIGKFNSLPYSIGQRFVVGNGTGSEAANRSNCFTIESSGLTKINATGYSNDQAWCRVGINNTDWIGLGIGSGGTRHGIYSFHDSDWLIEAEGGNTYAKIGSFNVDGNLSGGGTITSSGAIISGGNCRPSQDNKFSCGHGNYHWTKVFAKNGTIDTSDKKEKDIIGTIDYAKSLIMNLQPVEYQWKDSDHKRIHMGLIAQDVAKVGKAIGKDLSLYEASYKATSLADIEDDEKLKYHGEEADDEKLTWGLAYAELIAPMIKVIQDQEKRIQQLEEQLLKK